MAEQAHVRSMEAIAAFRAQLIVFLTKARALLDEVSDEKQRTKVWLESDRRPYWEAELRRRSLRLQQAQQELFTARLSRIQTATAAQSMAVERAERALRQAEAKREAVRRWIREFENRAEPLARQIDQLHSFLGTDLEKAVAYLAQVLGILESYAAEFPSGAPSTPFHGPESNKSSNVPVADKAAQSMPDEPEHRIL